MSFEIVQGDLEPDLTLTVASNGTPLDISASTSRTLHWRKPDGTMVDVSLTSVDLTIGKVKRIWAAGDTSITGVHRARVVVTWPTGETQTFPSDGSWYLWFVYSSNFDL